jgi:hypothetical protein
MDPYIERFHCDVCAHCATRETSDCPCPLDSLLLLAIQAVETVDERHGYGGPLGQAQIDEWEPLVAQT